MEAHTEDVRPLTKPFHLLLPFMFGLVASVADPILAASVLSTVTNVQLGATEVPGSNGLQFEGGLDASPLIAGAIYLFSVGTAYELGKLVAEYQCERQHRSTRGVLAAFAAIAWLAMGLSMSFLRAFEKVLTGGTAEEGQYDWVMALVMGVLYLGSGICIIAATHAYLTSPWHRVNPVVKKADRATAAANRAAAYQRHVELAVVKNAEQAKLWQADVEVALISLRNAEAQLKDQVRVALAAHLANPAESSTMRTAHKSTNADEPPLMGMTTPTPTATTEAGN